MKTRSEKELYKKMDKWEKGLVSAIYAVDPIVGGETTLGDLLVDLSCAIGWADSVAGDIKTDYQEYSDIPKRYYELADKVHFLTFNYMDGTYEVADMPLEMLDDYASKLDKAMTDLLYELREEF